MRNELQYGGKVPGGMLSYIRNYLTRTGASHVQLGRVSQYVFFALILVSLLSNGTVDPVALAVVSMLLGILTCWALIWLGEPRATVAAFRIAFMICIVLVGWIGIQCINFEWLANPIWNDLGGVVKSTNKTISIAPADSFASIVTLAMPFVVFLCGLILFPSDDDAIGLLSYISISGGVMATWSICEFLFSPNTLLLQEKFYYMDSLTAPFVNHNTAGTFYGLISILLAAKICLNIAQVDFQSLIFNTEIARGKKQVDLRIARDVFFFILSLVALFLTKSRGAVGATFIAYLVFVPLALYMPANGRRVVSFRSDWRLPAWRVLKSLIGLGAVVIVGVIFADFALFRAEVQGVADGRFCVAPAIMEAANNNKLTGVGFATFKLFFPAYRDPHCGIFGVWDRAHSVYLEGYLGLGVIFIAATALGVISLGYMIWSGVMARRGLRIYPIAGLGMLTLVLGHSLIDFSLQVPGFAVVFASSMAAVCTISRGRSFVSTVHR